MMPTTHLPSPPEGNPNMIHILSMSHAINALKPPSRNLLTSNIGN